ncbi:ComEC/Rec2 family competence protein [Croceicoccus ponticola]|uniref:ComEC/Rec2 family competence protein n=1 Tax=Croceicoccus ponticola TaxID=2217664 RepID=A0A437H0M4_9SPHN|nr:ComEC/Rec2 family competence protein [Croceicoccus ponticola]RVQ69062.1 ComEC/Rec2 family competence protein [Croceicoccus ponticola]
MTESVAITSTVTERAPLSSQVRQWGSLRDLSSPTCWENALAARPFERMSWLAVAMLGGIYAWFALPGPGEWILFIGLSGIVAGGSMILFDPGRFALVRNAIMAMALAAAAGLVLVWVRSELVGTPGIGRPMAGSFAFRIVERQDAVGNEEKTRLTVVVSGAMQSPMVARINLPERFDDQALVPGTIASARLRLIPPARAVAPGAYDPARVAWFEGIAATGSVLSRPAIAAGSSIAEKKGMRERLAEQVRTRMAEAGSEPSVAAMAGTLITGNRAGIAKSDAQAMRDAGLAHLLSISGLHVAAVISITWLIAMRSLALIPWVALRVPLPLMASLLAALSGLGYTLLTGAALPTIRSCIAAMLVLTALALGRQALSMRLIAVAAIAVLLFWPEAAISPSFQLSFAAVMAIVAVQNAPPVTRFRERLRGSGLVGRAAGWLALLFITGVVIELSLLPLVLFHFHRSGIYGAFVNLVAIPLTTIAIMPLLALALVTDLIGLGSPAWWLATQSISGVLELARFAAAAPGSARFSPVVPVSTVGLIAMGAFWIALWSGRGRMLGAFPVVLGGVMLATNSAPDLMVSGDGRHLALSGPNGLTFMLRGGDSFSGRALAELSGIAPERVNSETRSLQDWPGARCNEDFCALTAGRPDRPVNLLVALGPGRTYADSLKNACEQSDVVVAESPLSRSCQPRWLKLDGRELSRRGGATIDFSTRAVRHVRPGGDRHGW